MSLYWSNGEYITTVKEGCQMLNPKWQRNVGLVSMAVKCFSPPKLNISKMELRALKELRCDKVYVILTADKWVVKVVLDIQGYVNKAGNLLEQSGTERTITTVPTKKEQKHKLINVLKTVKAESGTCKRMHPTGVGPPLLTSSRTNWNQRQNSLTEHLCPYKTLSL